MINRAAGSVWDYRKPDRSAPATTEHPIEAHFTAHPNAGPQRDNELLMIALEWQGDSFVLLWVRDGGERMSRGIMDAATCRVVAVCRMMWGVWHFDRSAGVSYRSVSPVSTNCTLSLYSLLARCLQPKRLCAVHIATPQHTG